MKVIFETLDGLRCEEEWPPFDPDNKKVIERAYMPIVHITHASHRKSEDLHSRVRKYKLSIYQSNYGKAVCATYREIDE